MKNPRMDILKCINDYRKKHKTGPCFDVIGEVVGLAKTTVSYHLDQLEDDDLITSEYEPDSKGENGENPQPARKPRRRQGTLDLTDIGREKLAEYLANGQHNDNDEGEAPAVEPSKSSKKLFVGVNYVVMSARLSAFENIQYVDIPIIDTIAASFNAMVGTATDQGLGPEYTLHINENVIPERYKWQDLFAMEVIGESMVEVGVRSGDYVVLKPTCDAQNGDMCAVLIDGYENTLKFFYREKGRIRLKPANATMESQVYGPDRDVRIRGKVVMVLRH